MFRKAIKYLSLILFVLLIVCVIKSILFTSKQINIGEYPNISLPANTENRLASAIKCATISSSESYDSSSFQQLLDLIDSSYSSFHTETEKILLNDFGQIYKWNGRNSHLKPILLIAHSDVVPIASPKEWDFDPFSGAIDQQYVLGRGALDDKLSVMGLLEAANILIDLAYTPERSIYFAFGQDEEVGGQNGAISIARYFADQGIEFEYILDEGSVVLEEALPSIEEPVALIGIAEKGYLSLELNVQTNAGGHSSMPPKETSIGILSKAIHQLESNPFPSKIEGVTGQLFEYAGPEMNFINKLLFSNLWLFGPIIKSQLAKSNTTNAIIRTTTAATMINAGVAENVLSPSARAVINFRILPGESKVSVINSVKSIIDDPQVAVSILGEEDKHSEPSAIADINSFGYKVLEKTCREIFKEVVVAPSLVIATTDSRHYTGLSENVFRFLPVQLKKEDLSMIHGKNEKVSIENYHRLIRFYIQLIKNSSK